jgi:hypothetical protein
MKVRSRIARRIELSRCRRGLRHPSSSRVSQVIISLIAFSAEVMVATSTRGACISSVRVAWKMSGKAAPSSHLRRVPRTGRRRRGAGSGSAWEAGHRGRRRGL